MIFKGLDIPDIEVVVQLRYVSSLCTLMQRLGRGARGKGMTARGIYLVEPMYFEHNKNGKRQRGNSGTETLNKCNKMRAIEGVQQEAEGTSMVIESKPGGTATVSGELSFSVTNYSVLTIYCNR